MRVKSSIRILDYVILSILLNRKERQQANTCPQRDFEFRSEDTGSGLKLYKITMILRA